jgi:iron(III) transport system substrate-binding protein
MTFNYYKFKIILLSYLSLCFLNADLNIYTHRHYDSDKVLYENFTKLTGIKINVVKGSADQLIQRIESEGSDSPADVLLTVDAGRLVRAKALGLLQPINSDVLMKNVPIEMRDSENFWFGLTVRARVIVYAKDRVSANELSTYEDLASAKWKGRIVVRSSNNIYNQSLMASIINANGSESALKWAKKLRKNMARKPRGNDRDQARVVASGLADIAIVNTYYIGLLANSSDQKDRDVVDKLGLFFPNQNDRGSHINVSGGGVVANSKNKAEAIFFLEYMTLKKSQSTFANANYEYPLNYNEVNSSMIRKWGLFKADKLNLTYLGEKNSEAVRLFDKSGWK